MQAKSPLFSLLLSHIKRFLSFFCRISINKTLRKPTTNQHFTLSVPLSSHNRAKFVSH